ncbi:MAG: TonB-dependent receptor [Bacteroidetes bacterium]|uniref:SusC/RagA family TonB-linked outer membrane protein n=1 Tax=Phnomibacter sp. TaxID=2836217 RepID=UPI002FDE82AD|nr:TonB-dependent receptor [Bacteroidota bacterium]
MTLRRLLKGMVIPVLLLIGFAAAAQETILVSGKVSDSKDGSPLIGVSVAVKGTANGTATDGNGNFSLRTTPGATLVFTYVGYLSKEMPATKEAMTVTLENVKTALNEVVVIGYGSARKKDLTGAVSTVSSKDFQKGNITTPEQMIAGKVAGVQITSNGGRPGAGSTIRIRGGSSLIASNDPLIVIDGVPLDNNGVAGAANPLSFINANDIESYTVLKDASAAAIYGSRANNGVIIITTKKGKGGKLKVNFSSVNSISTITKKLDLLNADQVRAIVAMQGNATQKRQVGTASTDWQDVIYQTGFGTDNNISMSGGIVGLPYRFSVGYLDQTGLLKTDHLQRTSAALALNPSFFDNHLKVDLNLKGSMQQTRFANEGAIGSAANYDPTQPVYSNSKRFGGYQEWVGVDGLPELNAGRNPLGMLYQTFDNQKPRRAIGNLQLDYKFHFLPELRANVNLGFDVAKNTGTYLVPDSAASQYRQKGSFSQNQQIRRNTIADFYLNYAKDFKSIKSRVDFTAGYSYNNFWTKNFFYRGLNANKDTIVGSTPPNFAYDIPENTLMSYWGRLLYNYDSRYFLTATLRRDGSSRFAKENRWGWFPSVGVAWSIANEAFLKNSKVVSDLKVRVGYGKTGQQDGIGNYDYQARYGLGGLSSAYQLGNEYVLTYGPFGYNGGLKWEELVSYNAALDFGFFDGRITGSVDFYKRESRDLLNSVPQATGTNFSPFVLANIGSLENRGVEMTLSSTIIKKKDFSWDVNMNATYNENKILNLTVVPDDPTYKGLPTGGSEGVNGFVQMHSVGYSRNTFYLYQQIYDSWGNPIEGLFEDRNRDGIINDNDRYLRHSAVASWLFGFSTNVNWKKWTAGTVLRASLGNYVFNGTFANRGRLNQVLGNYVLGNASTNYTTTAFRGGNDIAMMSDYYVQNASFLRMDNLFVGYNFGKVMKNGTSLRVNAAVQNVFTVTKYKGTDPEHGGGIDNNLYPRPRIFSLSVNLDF